MKIETEKEAGVAILIISDKLDFKMKDVRIDKEGHYIVLKGFVCQENITLLNIYIPNTGAPKHMKERLLDLKEDIDCNTTIIEDLNIPLSPLNTLSRQKINEETQDLNDTIKEMDFTDIYRIFHPAITKYTLFSTSHGTFLKISHMIQHKTRLYKLKFIEIISITFSDQDGINLNSTTERVLKNTKTQRTSS